MAAGSRPSTQGISLERRRALGTEEGTSLHLRKGLPCPSQAELGSELRPLKLAVCAVRGVIFCTRGKGTEGLMTSIEKRLFFLQLPPNPGIIPGAFSGLFGLPSLYCHGKGLLGNTRSCCVSRTGSQRVLLGATPAPCPCGLQAALICADKEGSEAKVSSRAWGRPSPGRGLGGGFKQRKHTPGPPPYLTWLSGAPKASDLSQS